MLDLDKGLKGIVIELKPSMRCLQYAHLLCSGIDIKSFDSLEVVECKEQEAWREVLSKKKYKITVKLNNLKDQSNQVFIDFPQQLLEKIIEQQS